MKYPALPLVFLLLLATPACGQSADTLRADSSRVRLNQLRLDSLNQFFTYQDSLSIFNLIDSLLQREEKKVPSQLAVRLGYNSNIVSDNRTFNISQFGLAPGVSYYHPSGAYADVTAYWSQEYKPQLYLAIASGGYIKAIGKHYTLLAEYSHYFYNQPADSTVSVPYTNNIGLSNYYQVKWFMARLDYYFYFGDKQAHRLMPSLGINLVKRKWLKLDRVSFYPNAGVLFGTEQVSNYDLAPNILQRIVYNRTHSPPLPLIVENITTEYGIMNYSFSAPLTVTKGKWTLLLNYTYNIPKPLPSEEVSLQNSGYLSFSITRYFRW